ncbi:MAG: hypothetical protein EAZ63_11380 [Runella slithyformis]|nr:MAG: hypothetical protein EAZ63_11380 [Runella slithyformis]
MKKLLLFFASLATLLWLLTSCDSFKKNDVNPAPTTEGVSKAVVDLVKLYYPNATDIVIKEIVKDRVWSARFFVGDQEITLSVDNNNEIIKSTNASRVSGEVLDIPDKILAYIKANYNPKTNFHRFSVLLDENSNRQFYTTNLNAYNGLTNNSKSVKFDLQGNFVGDWVSNWNRGLGSFISQSYVSNLNGIPQKIQKFIERNNISQYQFTIDRLYENSEGTYSIRRNNFTNGSVFELVVLKPSEKIYPSLFGVGNRAYDWIRFSNDGSFIEWESALLNSTRGDKTVEIAEGQITSRMTQIINQMFGIGKWRLDYGVEFYNWFTRNSQVLRIELLAQPNIYYEIWTACDGNLPDGFVSGSFSQLKLIKSKQDIPEAALNELNQRFSNWKVIFGRISTGQARIPTGEITPTTFNFYLFRIEANGKIYEIDNGNQKFNIAER